MITRDTVVIGVKSGITPGIFEAVLKTANSPAAGVAKAAYAVIKAENIPPEFILAIFWKESRFATDPDSMVVRHKTFNPGNCRTSSIGDLPVIDTERGPFVDYDNWLDGFKDAAHRLTDSRYPYAQENRRTIAQIIERWAPAKDNNNPAAYTDTVVKLMNKWIGVGDGGKGATVMFDLNNIPFKQSPNCDKGGNSMKKVVIHSTEGSYSSSVNWLLSTAAQASAHYVINEDGSECTQLVKDEDIAWHCGNYAYNQMCIGIEHSWFSDGRNGPPPDTLYQAGAKLAATLCKKHGIVPNRGNIIAHGEIPPPNNHRDPGPRWDWSKFMAYVVHYFNGSSIGSGGTNVANTDGSTPNIPAGMVALDNPNNLDIYNDAFKDPVTGFQVIQPFCVFYRDNGGLAVFGHPTSGLYGATPGGQDQTFEYARFWLDKASGKVMAELKDHNNPKGFAVGGGVMATLKAENLVAISNEDYYSPNKGVGSGLTQRSFTYAQDKDGVTFRVEAIQDQDSNNKPLPTWSTQIWKFVK